MSLISYKIDAIYRTSQTSKMPVSLIWMSTKKTSTLPKKLLYLDLLLKLSQLTCPGVEPGTSRTVSKKHATRPTGQGSINLHTVLL